MTPNTALLRTLPQVEEVLHNPTMTALAAILPHDILVDCIRKSIDEVRQQILAGELGAAGTAGEAESVDGEAIADAACTLALSHLRPSLRRVINATGVVIHTNLGRSALADAAVDAVVDAARGYSTLEYSVDTMARGSRHDHVEQLICSLTGAEAAIAVNNNAAAVMMVLNEFAQGHEAIVSRGELVEIGGSFRVPDIMAMSQAAMVEVGTTNKTHTEDYERAITPDTVMLLKVHPSNYRMVGFVESVPLSDLRKLADAENEKRERRAAAQGEDALPLMVYEDQGSGALLRLDCFGNYAEPTVAESLKGGVDLVSFSGDKLLGGPQAGIVVGKKELIARLKKNPLARALRLDKMTLAALEATLRLYLNPAEAMQQIPTLRMLTEDAAIVEARAKKLAKAIKKECPKDACTVDVIPETGRAGGGSLPMCDIDTFCAQITFAKGCAQDAESFLIQKNSIPVVGRIKKEAILLDARTIGEGDITEIALAVAAYCKTL